MEDLKKMLVFGGVLWFAAVGAIGWYVFHESWGLENVVAFFVFSAPGAMMIASSIFLSRLKIEPDSPSEPS